MTSSRIVKDIQKILKTNNPHGDGESEDADYRASQPHTRGVEPGMTYDEKVLQWWTTDPEDCEVMSTWEQTLDENTFTQVEDLDMLRIDSVTNTASFNWFLSSVRSRYRLDYSVADIPTSIRSSVAASMPRYRGNRALQRQQITLQMDWNPKLFAEQQGFPGVHSLPSALVITGSALKSQLSTCRNYLKETWPTTGEAVLEGLVELATATNSDITTTRLFDGLTLALQLADATVQVHCDGLLDSILEVVEILAWLGAALREASSGNRVTYSVADVRINEKAAEVDHTQLSLTFTEEEIPSAAMLATTDGGCWLHGMFKNPVIVKGFPIPTRQDWGIAGIEVPLAIMAPLVHTAQLTLFSRCM